MEGPKIEEVLTYLDENFDNDLKAVQDFMRMKSISATGEGIRETAERVKEMIEECGGTSELIETPGNPIVYGRIDEKAEHTLLIYSMYDVLPAEEPDWIFRSVGSRNPSVQRLRRLHYRSWCSKYKGTDSRFLQSDKGI